MDYLIKLRADLEQARQALEATPSLATAGEFFALVWDYSDAHKEAYDFRPNGEIDDLLEGLSPEARAQCDEFLARL